MDTIFYNGIIHSLDSAQNTCSALAVKNGIIISMGHDEEILEKACDETQIINLHGSLMLPGFTDSHMHLLYFAQLLQTIDLSEATSFQDVKVLFQDRIKSNPPAEGKWFSGTGFNQDNWDIKKVPTRRDLDMISEEIPITIRRACLHITVCNTRAMQLLNLMDARSSTTDISMGFYEDGTPDGILKEDSQNLVAAIQPKPDSEEISRMIMEASQLAASKGITEIHSDDFKFLPDEWGKTIIDVYTKLSDAEKLPVRIYQQCSLWDMSSLQNFLESGFRTGYGSGFYHIGPLKLILDGSLGAHTAWLKAPYKNAPETCGMANMTDDELYNLMRTGHEHGLQIAVHCIGDAALQQALECFNRIQSEHPRSDCRHGIVHCQIMSSEQQEQFRKQNLLAYVQPIFLRCDMNIVEDCIEQELVSQSYNWRRFIDLGVHMSGGSDCPVEAFDILPNLEYAVTRMNPDTGQCWIPENAVSLDEAIRMFTTEGAYTSFSESVRGTLSIGKYADLVVLNKNILRIPADEIHTAKVLLTMVGGRIIFKSDDFHQ